MQRAIRLAAANVRSGRGGPFGALIVKNNRVIAEGTNLVTSTNDPSAHAEITAIRRACKKLKSFQLTDCELYTSCEPCPMCLGAIYWARPAKVYYAGTASDAAAVGFDDSYIYRQLPLPPRRRDIPMIPLLRAGAQLAFDAWKRKSDKTPY